MKVIRLILTLLHLVLFALAAMLLNSFIPPKVLSGLILSR